jgi:hypothetical protein
VLSGLLGGVGEVEEAGPGRDVGVPGVVAVPVILGAVVVDQDLVVRAGWMALALNSGSPHVAARAAEVRVVAEPCQTRGAPANGRGSVVASRSGARNAPVQVTFSSRHSRRSSGPRCPCR